MIYPKDARNRLQDLQKNECIFNTKGHILRPTLDGGVAKVRLYWKENVAVATEQVHLRAVC